MLQKVNFQNLTIIPFILYNNNTIEYLHQLEIEY